MVVIEQTLGGQHLIPLSRAFIRVATLNHSSHESEGQLPSQLSWQGPGQLETVRHLMIMIAPSDSKSEKHTASGSLRL